MAIHNSYLDLNHQLPKEWHEQMLFCRSLLSMHVRLNAGMKIETYPVIFEYIKQEKATILKLIDNLILLYNYTQTKDVQRLTSQFLDSVAAGYRLTSRTKRLIRDRNISIKEEKCSALRIKLFQDLVRAIIVLDRLLEDLDYIASFLHDKSLSERSNKRRTRAQKNKFMLIRAMKNLRTYIGHQKLKGQFFTFVTLRNVQWIKRSAQWLSVGIRNRNKFKLHLNTQQKFNLEVKNASVYQGLAYKEYMKYHQNFIKNRALVRRYKASARSVAVSKRKKPRTPKWQY